MPFAFTLSHASDVTEGLNYLKNRKPDLILLDAELMKQPDFSAFKQLVQKENVPSILLAETNDEETAKQAGQAGAVDFMVKNKINLFHLQKTIANALKLSETEAKLDTTYHEFSAQHNALYRVLNKMSSGVMVINAQNTIRYANAKAYSILGEEGIKKHLAEHLSYRLAEEDEQIELKPKKNLAITIRISDIEWNGEPANLFVLDRIKTKEERADAALKDETFVTLLNTLSENILLMKGDTIVQANKPALQILKLKPNTISNKLLKEVFESDENTPNEISVQSFLAGKSFAGHAQVLPMAGATRAV